MPHSTVGLVERVSPVDSMSQQHGVDMSCILGVVSSRLADGTDIAGDSTGNQLEILP